MRNTVASMWLILVVTAPAVAAEANNLPIVQATGIGRPPRVRPPAVSRLMARRAAEVVAVRNLALKFSDGPESAQASTRVSATVQGYRYLPAVYRADGTVEVTVEMLLPAAPK